MSANMGYLECHRSVLQDKGKGQAGLDVSGGKSSITTISTQHQYACYRQLRMTEANDK